MDVSKILGWMIIIFLFCFIGIIIFDGYFQRNALDTACNDLGMKKAYISNFKPSYCIDHNNLAHHVIFECERVAWSTKCKASLVATKGAIP